jgi:hypothetical protein
MEHKLIKGCLFQIESYVEKCTLLLAGFFFSLFAVLSSRWIGDPSTGGMSQIWVVVKDKCKIF